MKKPKETRCSELFMEDNKNSFYDEFELPRNRKKRILEDLNTLDDSFDDDVILMSSSKKENKKNEVKEENEDLGEWLSTLSSLSQTKLKATRKAKDLFGGKKKKKNKDKKKGEPTNFSKEFEPEVALLNNLLIDQNRFVDSLQQQYDRMTSLKSTARGTGKFTTDLCANINTGRQLAAQLVEKKINTKKIIADLEMKERKDLGLGENTDDLNNFAAEYLKNILVSRPDMSSNYGNFDVEDMDEDDFINSIGNSVEDTRSDEVGRYLKYENRNVKIIVRMNKDDYDDYEFIAEASDGEILLDYPLPEHTSLSVNRSTMIATDTYGKKYPIEFV